MSVILIFIIFLLCMAVSLLLDISMIVPISIGFILFFCKALSMGNSIKDVLKIILPGMKDSVIVVRILLLIGCLTGIWRVCGTIPYFVVAGVQILPPSLFILTAFLLSSAMSFALGTSFGVTATCGTILIAIARAGNASVVVTAAAVLSGVYVGDRGSPSASSANLVAVLTHTDMRNNIKHMFRTAVVPFIISTMLYFVLSFFCPIGEIDMSLVSTLENSFNLSVVCLIPAVIMIILPFCHVPIIVSMALSIIVSLVIGYAVQGLSVLYMLKVMILGYSPDNSFLNSTLSGGGLLSMAEVCCILIISGTYSGLLNSTRMLDSFNEKAYSLSSKIGRFPVMIIMGILVSAIFCNQTIGVIMQSQLSSGLYGDSDAEKDCKMIDIENSTIVIAGLIPWCIASSVPLNMLGADYRSLPLAFFLWLIPVCHAFHQHSQASNKDAAQ